MENNLPNVVILPDWHSVKQFAAASGVQRRTVHLRIKRSVLTSIEVDGLRVIDASMTPPVRVLPRKIGRAPVFHWPPHLPQANRLVQVKQFCERNGIRGHAIYTDIILGKLTAYYFAESVFVENIPELQEYVTHRRTSWQIRQGM